MDHVIYGTLLECKHTEKSSTKKSNQTLYALKSECGQTQKQAVHHVEGKFLLVLKNKQTKLEINHYTI